MATQIGFISAIIGTATATTPDGATRQLQAGDKVYQNELITTGPGGAIEIQFSDGSIMDLGRQSQAMLDTSVFDPAMPATDVAETADDDVEAIQQALLAGEDPTVAGEATAAGPGAGGGDGSEGGSSFVVRDYLNPEVTPTSGFDTIGVNREFDETDDLNLILVDEAVPVVLPQVSVSIQVDNPQSPPGDSVPTQDYPVLVEGNAASVLEGTSGDEPREITFLLTLSEAFSEDVIVTYELRPISADSPEDWFNGSLVDSVVIPAGTTQIPVTVTIVQDHLDEGNESFDIILLSATNATINPESDTAIVTIFDDDTTPVAQDDVNEVFEDDFVGESEVVSVDGNVIAGTNAAGIDPLTQNDSDEDGDVLEIVSFSNGEDSAVPGATLNGLYGTLTLNANGSYTYVLNNDDPLIQSLIPEESLSDVFSYIVTDTYNAEQTANLTINIQGTDDGVFIQGLDNNGAEETVYEADLPAGSDPDASELTQTGEFSFEALDGLANINIGGADFDLAALQALDGSQTINSPYGTLTILGYDGNAFGGTIEYSYELENTVDNASQAGADDGSYVDSFVVVVTDENNSQANASLDIEIVDDEPEAEDDGPAAVTEDGTSVVSGNVLDNDDVHADQPADFVGWSADGFDNSAAITALNTFGNLVQNSDGSWSYTLDNSQAATQALDTDDQLSYDLYYTMADADGDESVAKLTININGADDNATVDAGGGESVYEAGLPDGSANDDSDLVTDGELDISASDGIASVTIGGMVFSFADVQAFDGSDTVNTDQGIITLQSYSGDAFNGTITYDYALSATIDNDDAAPTAPELVDGDSYLDVVAIEVDGVGGSNASDDLEISIIDDGSLAQDDGPEAVTEDGTSVVSGNVLDNDDAHADQPADFVGWGDDQDNLDAIAALNTYGTLVQNANGTWSYTLDNSDPDTQALTSADSLSYDLTYTMADADGDESPAKLTITIQGADDDASVVTAEAEGPDATVYEAGLNTDGSDAGSDSETATGSFDVSASDGILNVVVGGTTFTLAEVQAFAGTNGVVNTGEGTLTLTGYSGDIFNGTISYSYTLDATIDNDSKIPTGDDAVTLTHFDDSVEISVNGLGGTNASDDLVIRAIDDVPSATDDGPAAVTEDGTSFVEGNVLDNDNAYADQPAAFVGWSADGFNNAAAITALNTYGTLVQNTDGSWSYTLDNSLAATQALDAEDQLSYDLYYTMADADGDESVAKLTININGADDNATVDAGGGETVYEAGLPDGSANDDSDLVTDGELDISASDGIASVTIGGMVFSFADLQAFDGSDTVNTDQGIITLQSYSGDAFNGTITYDYALSATIDNDDAAPTAPEVVDGDSYLDVVAIEVGGVGGSSASDNLEISIIDDQPEAEDDGVINVAEDTATTFSVFGNDEFGADDVDTDNDPSTVVTHSSTSNGTVSYNAGTGQFTYTPDAGYAGSDSFTYTIKDGDGDTSTATVSLLVAADSTPQIGQTENLIVDEDGVDYAADDAETSRDDETDSNESLTDSGIVTVDFGNDVPVNLLSSIVLVDEIDLDSQLTSDGEPVMFTLESGELVGRADGTEVIRIEITNAVPGANSGEVDYTYQVTLSQPVEHADGALENSELLSGVKFTVTDSDNTTADGTFDVTIVDDVPDIAPISFGSIEDGQTFNDISLESLFGADGPGDIAFASSLDGADVLQVGEQVLFDGEPLTWSLSGDVLIAKTPSDIDAITITINDADGNYDISVADGTFYLEGGVQTFAIGDLSGSNALAWVGQSAGIDTLIISEGTSTNTSNAGGIGYVGAGSQWIDTGTSDSTTFYFYDDIDAPTGSLGDQTELDAALENSLVAGVNSFSISVNTQGGNTTTLQLLFVAVDGTLGSAEFDIESNGPSNPYLLEIDSADITWDGGQSGLAIASVEFPASDVDYRVGGDLVYTEITPADIELDLPVTISDSDGDTSDGTITGTITSEGVASPLTLSEIPDELYVGTNDPNIKVTEGGNDVLIGDLGGRELQFNPGKDYSIALIADESGSMAGDRIQLLKEALVSFVNDLAGHDGVINIALIGFGPGANIEISVADLTTENGLDDLLAEIDALVATGGTNYEAAFEKAVEWFQGQPDGHEFISYFMTDGDPTLYNGGGDGNDTDFETFQAAVEAFEALSAISELNGIGIGSGVNEDYLRFFDNTNINGTDTESFGESTLILANFSGSGDPLDTDSDWTVSGDTREGFSISGGHMDIEDRRGSGATVVTSAMFVVAVDDSILQFDYETSNLSSSDELTWSLQRQEGGNWVEVSGGELEEDQNGDSVQSSPLQSGNYRLVYTVEDSATNGNSSESLEIDNIELRVPEQVTGPVGQPQIIHTAGDLIAELQAGNTTNTPEQLGDDVLEGGDGDDVLFGDTIHTDDLTWTNTDTGEEFTAGHGLGYEGLVEYLTWAENDGTAPDDAQIMQYIRDNYESLINPNPTQAEMDAAGDDTLIGGAGNDILSGGSGADIFIWNNGDEGTPSTPAHDVIIDFNTDEGDSLDLADMLQGEEDGVLTDYLNVQETGSDVVISVSPDGSDVTQVITLTDTTLTDLGAGGLSEQVDIINKLVADGTLHVDQS